MRATVTERSPGPVFNPQRRERGLLPAMIKRERRVIVRPDRLNEGVEESRVEAAAAGQLFASGAEKIEAKGRELLCLAKEFGEKYSWDAATAIRIRERQLILRRPLRSGGSMGDLVHVIADALAEGEQLDDAVVEALTPREAGPERTRVTEPR